MQHLLYCCMNMIYVLLAAQHLLYEALLAHNEALGLLHNVIMLGNSLEGYADAWNTRPKQRPDRPHVLLGLVQAGRVSERAVPCGETEAEPLGAFNNTALHTFREAGSGPGH